MAPSFRVDSPAQTGDSGFGITDLEGQVEIRLPLFDSLPPVKIIPSAAVRFWDGPTLSPPAHA